MHAAVVFFCAIVVVAADVARAADPATAPAPASRAERILVVDISGDVLTPQEASLFGDAVAKELERRTRAEVLSSADVRRVADTAADRQNADCSSTACLAELGAAMGANRVLHATVAKLGARLVLNLTLIEPAAAKTLGRATTRADDVEKLFDTVPAAVAEMLSGVPSASSSSTASSSSSSPEQAPYVWSAARTGSSGGVASAAGTPNFSSSALAAAVLALTGGVCIAYDVLAPGSADNRVGLDDFVGPIGYVSAAAAVSVFVFSGSDDVDAGTVDAGRVAVGREEPDGGSP